MKRGNIQVLFMVLFMATIPLFGQVTGTNKKKTDIFKKLNLEKELKSTPKSKLKAYKESNSSFNDEGLETIKRKQHNNRKGNFPKTFLSLKLGIDDPWIGFTYERVILQRVGLEFQIGILGAALGGKLYAPTVEYKKFNAYVGVLTGIGFGGHKNTFIQKLNSEGELIWVKQLESEHTSLGYDIDLDKTGNVYVLGGYSGKVDFDPGLETDYLTTTGSQHSKNGFILKLDNTGNYIWVKQMICSKETVNNSIAVDSFNNIYAVGNFQGTIDLDPSIDAYNITSAEDNHDAFISKYIQCNLTSLSLDIDSLPTIETSCSFTPSLIPTANDGCRTYLGSASISFPITDTTITKIVWTFTDNKGNILTQTQKINWSTIDIEISLGDQFISSNSINSTYQWLNCDNDFQPIEGEISQTFNFVDDGNYAVELTKNGCVDTSACVLIDNSSNIFNVIASPNPTNDIIYIEFDRQIEFVELNITDLLLGRSVYTVYRENMIKMSVDLKDLFGVYCLTLKTNKGKKTVKIIKN